MPFPLAPSIRYKKNALSQVICQLRFPAILRIDADIPAAFQESIRGFFPNFAQTSVFKVPIPSVSNGIGAMDKPQQTIELPEVKNYEFSTLDGNWKVNLGRTFIALSSHKYTSWGDFREHFKVPLLSFMDIYSPTQFNRIGLRYVNSVRRSSLGVSSYPWSGLILSYLIGILAYDDAMDAVDDFECMQELTIEERCKARIMTKLLRSPEDDEGQFILDIDFYDQLPTNIGDAQSRMDQLNTNAYNFFNWSVRDCLKAAMEAETI